MPRRTALIMAAAVVVALCLTISGCRLQTDDAANGGAQPDSPNIEATVAVALRSLEERKPEATAESAGPTSVAAQPDAPAAVPTNAPSPSPPPDPTQASNPRLAATTAAILTPSPTAPPTVEITPTAEMVRTTAESPTPTPAGADQRAPAPMFAGTFMDGNDYRLEDTVGTPTLLMFWAPW